MNTNQMKLGVAVSTFEINQMVPVLFRCPSEENYSTIKDIGYDGVDLLMDSPSSEGTKNSIKYIKKYNLGIGSIMGSTIAKDGLFLTGDDAECTKQCLKRLLELIYFASEIGASGVCIGIMRGNIVNGQVEKFYKELESSLEKLIKVDENVPLFFEPINRYEVNSFNSAKESLNFIKSTGLPLKIMLDTFHMNIEDVDMFEVVREASNIIGHVHFVDSNRLAPSMGHTDMVGLYNLIAEQNYKGYLTIEAYPKPTALDICQIGMDFFINKNK